MQERINEARARLAWGPGESQVGFLAQRPPRGWVKETYYYLQQKWVCKTHRSSKKVLPEVQVESGYNYGVNAEV